MSQRGTREPITEPEALKGRPGVSKYFDSWKVHRYSSKHRPTHISPQGTFIVAATIELGVLSDDGASFNRAGALYFGNLDTYQDAFEEWGALLYFLEAEFDGWLKTIEAMGEGHIYWAEFKLGHGGAVITQAGVVSTTKIRS